MFRDHDGHPTVEMTHGHVGNDASLFSGRVFKPEVFAALLRKLGLEWCEACGDFHELAGGSSATRTESPYAGHSDTPIGGMGGPA